MFKKKSDYNCDFFRIRYKSIKSRIVFHVVPRHYVSLTKKKYAKANQIHKSPFVLNISPIIWKENTSVLHLTATTLQQDDLFKRDNSFG